MSNRRDLNSFHRAQLYEEVWTIPMVHVGKKYGLSGTAIKRICDELHIPVPEPGHWTRAELGHSVQRPPLPALSEQPTTKAASPIGARPVRKRGLVETPRPASDERAVDRIGMAARQTRERWHPMLNGLRQQMEKDAGKADQLKKKHDWEQAHPGKKYPTLPEVIYGNWEYFCDAGQLLLTLTHRKLVARLSLDCYKRGLSLLNAICHQAEQRGYSVSMQQGEERLRLSRDEAYVELRITEKLVAGIRYRVNSWDKSRQPVRTRTATGKLALFVERQGTGQTELADRPDELLENQFDRIFEAIEHQHKGSLARVAERAKWEQDRRESEIRRQEEERQRREAQRRCEEETQQRQALISEVDDWQRAELIRAYLTMLDSRIGDGGQTMDGYSQWRAWAQVVANDLDRSDHRVGPCA
ncbi:hypothetical protein QCE63_01390 [Caballeronia sp. LZ065]|uniref:hypothetical protein n=1 Tax=Caballeronia sp. LZ065 TaxID=3038571 RepID=UPI00286053C7|nr:hypothetical protein [Caballeronia sp. LZ065]MDR5778079.1 hypothetical protein [Caballeronia sp. LZ065]